MKATATATFKSTSWSETTLGEETDAPKLTRADCTQVYSGEIEGKSTLTYLMTYLKSGEANFIGLERVVGRLGDHRGSFVLRHEGVFRDGVARMSLSVVEGSGTGELEGLSGRAEFESPHAEEYSIDFNYEIQRKP